jgi:hypothetical protein
LPLWSLSALAIAFAIKHFVADFILQTNWIAQGKERPEGWFFPLAAHVLCHTGLTLLIALAVAPGLWWLALVDLIVHSLIDRGKSLANNWGGWSPQQYQYWWLLGLDQLLHQITNVALAAAMLAL